MKNVLNPVPISPNIGAIIYDFDFKNKILNDEHIQEIRNMLLKYQVIFFKNQSPIDQHEYFKLITKIYDVISHPFISQKETITGISPFQPYPEYPEINGIYTGNNKSNLNEWHSDLNWLEKPSFGSVLRAKIVPKVGGDTIFASMTKAYEDLSSDMKEKIENLYAYHDCIQIYGNLFRSENEKDKVRKLFPPRAKKIALKHPITGKKSIFVNRVSTTKILDFPEEEGKKLLEELYQKATIPEYHARYHWENNDIAFWDNLSTQHYAVSDYWPEKREMERISLAGIEV